MWPHVRVAWWDVKCWIAMRARRIAAAVVMTALAGSGLAAYQYYGSQPIAGDVADQNQPNPAVDPTIPWATPGTVSDPGAAAPAPTTTPTLISPTQPWPGTNP